MGFEMRKRGKYEGAEKFIERMRSVQEEAKAVLQKVQEDMKWYMNREKEEVEEYRVGITDGYLLVCDLQEWSSKGSKMQSILATKDVVKSEV